MLAPRIQQHFFDSADLLYRCADPLVRPMEQAVAALVAGLTAGGRVLVAAPGPAQPLGQLLACTLMGGFERERPGLAALVLAPGACHLASEGDAQRVLARQVDTLGQPGDLLLVIDHAGSDAALLAAVQAAHRQEMTVIALTGPGGTPLAGLLGETDVLVPVPHERRARVLEVQLLLLHCLCDAIDQQLMGEQDSE